jgi:hypothetical protein
MTLVICACSAALKPEKSMGEGEDCKLMGCDVVGKRVQSLSVELSIPRGELERTHERERQVYFC